MGGLCSLLAGTGGQDEEYSGDEQAPLTLPRRGGQHNATLIFLHGLGDTGRGGWSKAFSEMDLPEGLKVVLPTAPTRAVTLNGGMRMPAWYDIFGLTAGARQDAEGIARAARRLAELVEAEVQAGIDPSRIIVGGFSQGGSVALHLMFNAECKHRVGGIIGLSTWLPLAGAGADAGGSAAAAAAASAVSAPSVPVPVLLCHGEVDPLVPLAFGKASAALITGRGAHVAWHQYERLAHGSCAAELAEVAKFVAKAFSGSSSLG